MKNIIRCFSIVCSAAYCFFSFSTIYGQGIPAVDSLITQQIAAKNISGGVAYVWHQNKVIVDKAYGFADRDNQISMQPNAIFRLASNTKAIISISVLQLVEKGKIRLDDPIELYIPAFGNQKVFTNPKDTGNLVDRIRSVTVRDLLTHQSGISSADEYPAFKWAFEKYHLNAGLGKYYASLEEEVNQIAIMPLVHQPGERFSYGLSTNVLGRLIEVCSGLSLDRYLKKNIFNPLGMEDTYFYLLEEKADRLVKVYTKLRPDSLQVVTETMAPIDYPLRKNEHYFSAIGGLVSTTSDYARFLQCLLNEGKWGKKQIIGKAILQEFWTNQLGNKTFIFSGFPSVNNFGLGVGLTTVKGISINHAAEGSFFWGGAFNTAFMVDRKRKLITLFFFQRMPFVLAPLLSNLEKVSVDYVDQLPNQSKDY